MSGDVAHDDEAALFARFAATRDRKLRNELVERYVGLAVHIAQRFGRPAMQADLRQVAMIGLVKAVDRFDPEYGSAFSAFAGSTIEGELKRHLRDHSWVVRVPRSAKELHLAVRQAGDELQQSLGRSPTVAELAAHLRVDRDDVLRGLSATAAYEVGTIDAPGQHTAAPTTEGQGLDHVIDQSVVEQLLGRLPEREREIVRRRFFEEQSQSEIAEAMGMSQMHVSRLLRRSFDQMRAWLEAGDD